MNCCPQDAQVRTTRLSFSSSLGCFFHHAFLHLIEQKRWLSLALSGSRFPHMAHFRVPGFFCRCTNTFSAETSMPSSADISLYCLPAARMSRIVLFSFSVIEKTSSRLVAARGGKKGRFHEQPGSTALITGSLLQRVLDRVLDPRHILYRPTAQKSFRYLAITICS